MKQKLTKKDLDKIALEDGFPIFIGRTNSGIRNYIYSNGNSEDVLYRVYSSRGKVVVPCYKPQSSKKILFHNPIELIGVKNQRYFTGRGKRI